MTDSINEIRICFVSLNNTSFIKNQRMKLGKHTQVSCSRHYLLFELKSIIIFRFFSPNKTYFHLQKKTQSGKL